MENQKIIRYPKIPVLFVGIFTGFILAGLIFVLINFYLNARSAGSNSKINTKNLTLSVTSPDKNQATAQKEVQVSGSTGKESIVTVSTATETKILETKSALFSSKLSLREGVNVIQIVAFDPNTGESETTNRQILYLENELTDL